MKYFLIPTICLAAASLAPAQKVKTKAEAEAVNAMIQAQTPDASIAAAENVINKFAKTEFKSIAFYVEADAYQRKGDSVKAITYAEESVAADPKNWDADALLANLVAESTHDEDLDRDEKVARVDKITKDLIDNLKTAQKSNPQMTDDQWNAQKNSDTAQAYQAMGIVAQAQKKYDDAAADFQKGLDVNPDPALMVREGRALLLAKKYDDATSLFDKAIAAPNAVPAVKTAATQGKTQAAQLKAQGK